MQGIENIEEVFQTVLAALSVVHCDKRDCGEGPVLYHERVGEVYAKRDKAGGEHDQTLLPVAEKAREYRQHDSEEAVVHVHINAQHERRPLYLIREDDIKAWRDYNGLHFLQCACKFTDTCTTCNNGQNHSKRQETKELIRELKKSNPDVEKCLFRALGNVHLDTMIGYKTGGVRHSFLEDYDK